MAVKLCTICKINKQLTDFCKSKNTKTGLSYECTDCSKIRAKLYYDTHKEQQKCFHYTNLQPLWAKENLTKRVSLK